MLMTAGAFPVQLGEQGRGRAHEPRGFEDREGPAVRRNGGLPKRALMGQYLSNSRIASYTLNPRCLPRVRSGRMLVEEVVTPVQLHLIHLSSEPQQYLCLNAPPSHYLRVHLASAQVAEHAREVRTRRGTHNQVRLLTDNPLADLLPVVCSEEVPDLPMAICS